ncbi:hypothetical protein [Methylosinus sporium]|uniref:hypothetical protein n=1 Tax=Methylosinus sporium TaxID=428 RepID=UPI001304B7A5|nr:hypothetical protein [Methylosinus sporium]
MLAATIGSLDQKAAAGGGCAAGSACAVSSGVSTEGRLFCDVAMRRESRTEAALALSSLAACDGRGVLSNGNAGRSCLRAGSKGVIRDATRESCDEIEARSDKASTSRAAAIAPFDARGVRLSVVRAGADAPLNDSDGADASSKGCKAATLCKWRDDARVSAPHATTSGA